MTRKYYNKLVRDNIPEIIKSRGAKCTYETMSEEKFLEALNDKLNEEVCEYQANPCAEELADILTVIYYLMHTLDCENETIEIVEKKLEERGGFDNRVFLKWVEE